jgi:hypothetical protein
MKLNVGNRKYGFRVVAPVSVPLGVTGMPVISPFGSFATLESHPLHESR